MKYFLMLLVTVGAAGAGVYYTKPVYLSRPKIWLSQAGLIKAPRPSKLIPENEDNVLLLGFTPPKYEFFERIYKVFFGNLAQVKQLDLLETQIDEKLEKIAGIEPDKKKKKKSNYDALMEIKKMVDSNIHYLKFRSQTVIGVRAKKAGEVKGKGLMGILSAFPVYAIVRAPLDVPTKMMWVAPEDLKSAILTGMEKLAEMQQLEAKQIEKFKVVKELLSKSSVKKIWHSGVFGVEFSNTELANITFYVFGLDKDTIVVSNDKDSISPILDMASRHQWDADSKKRMQMINSHFTWGQVEVDRALQSLGGMMAKVAAGVLGGLQRLSLYQGVEKGLSFGVEGEFTTELEAQAAKAKLDGIFKSDKAEKLLSKKDVGLVATGNKLSLKYSITEGHLAESLKDLIQEDLKSTTKKWQTLAGIEQMLARPGYEKIAMKERLNLEPEQNVPDNQMPKKLSRAERMRLAMRQMRKLDGKVGDLKSLMLPALFEAKMKGMTPKVLFISGSCFSEDVKISAYTEEKGKRVAIPARELYASVPYKNDFDYSRKNSKMMAIDLNVKKPVNNFVFEIKIEGKDEGGLTEMCSFSAPPILVAEVKK